MLLRPRKSWWSWRTIAAAPTISPRLWCALEQSQRVGFHGCAQGRGNMRPATGPREESKYGEAKPDVRKPIGEGSTDREPRGGHWALPRQRLAGRQSGGLKPSRPRVFRGRAAGG